MRPPNILEVSVRLQEVDRAVPRRPQVGPQAAMQADLLGTKECVGLLDAAYRLVQDAEERQAATSPAAVNALAHAQVVALRLLEPDVSVTEAKARVARDWTVRGWEPCPFLESRVTPKAKAPVDPGVVRVDAALEAWMQQRAKLGLHGKPHRTILEEPEWKRWLEERDRAAKSEKST